MNELNFLTHIHLTSCSHNFIQCYGFVSSRSFCSPPVPDIGAILPTTTGAVAILASVRLCFVCKFQHFSVQAPLLSLSLLFYFFLCISLSHSFSHTFSLQPYPCHCHTTLSHTLVSLSFPIHFSHSISCRFALKCFSYVFAGLLNSPSKHLTEPIRSEHTAASANDSWNCEEHFVHYVLNVVLFEQRDRYRLYKLNAMCSI